MAAAFIRPYVCFNGTLIIDNSDFFELLSLIHCSHWLDDAKRASGYYESLWGSSGMSRIDYIPTFSRIFRSL